MKKMMLILMAGLMLISLNVYAQDDVSIDSDGNVKTGVTNTNANFEVTGASLEHAIVGETSGTGAIGVIGVNSDSNYVGFLGTEGAGAQGQNISNDNFGKLGTEFYGVYGHSTGTDNWAGYFQGNAQVTGDLTVGGSVLGPSIGDITGVTAGTGLTGGGTSGTVILDADTDILQMRVNGSCPAGQAIREISSTGTVTCEVDDNSGGTMTGVTAGTGLSGGGTSGNVILDANTTYLQRRVSSSCTVGSSIREINEDGTVLCEKAFTHESLCVLYRSTGAHPPAYCFSQISDTGQTSDYTAVFGEDSDYTIRPPSYTDNGDGTVTDNVTGLTWQKIDDGDCLNTWEAAITHCEGLSFATYSDWRLPDEFELMGIVNYGTLDPFSFPYTSSMPYWSSTTYAPNSANAWVVNFDSGDVLDHDKAETWCVRCVRGGQ